MSDIREVDWETWTAGMHATLLFVKQGEQVLLIEKQRGIGAGKINGPGGKIDPGETPLQCAVREVKEELLITVTDPVKMGELFFDMNSMPNIHCHVYMGTKFEGTPSSTEEAIPLWTAIEEIPFDKMWEDDKYWLTEMLAGQKFVGRFIFDQERLLGKEVSFAPAVAQNW